MRPFALILAATLLTGCHESGTWQDDERNWKRIFRVAKPDDITVVHSWYWRSPHFTYEYEYYLQIKEHADFQKHLLAMNSMTEVSDEEQLRKTIAGSQRRPEWFAPKPIAQYQVWVYSNAPNSDFRLLIDRAAGDLFVADRQL